MLTTIIVIVTHVCKVYLSLNLTYFTIMITVTYHPIALLPRFWRKAFILSLFYILWLNSCVYDSDHGDPEIFLDMIDVQQEVLAAPNIPQAVQSPAGAFLSPALTFNHSLSEDLVADRALSTAALDCLTTTKTPGTVNNY